MRDFTESPGEVAEGIRRVTFRLPLGIDHVHCYFLRGSGGGWILVDTGLGFDDPEAVWRPVLDALDAPVETVVVTHDHPDHVGGAGDLEALLGVPVYEGRADYARAVVVWGPDRVFGRIDEHLRAHGVPEELLGRPGVGDRVRIPREPVLLDPGDELDGWRVHLLPGHAAGHIVLERDGVLVAGDTILRAISPHVGLYPGDREDPLDDYLGSLGWIERLAPRLTLPGHGPLIGDADARAREIARHHDERLALCLGAVQEGPATAFEVALSVFGERLAYRQSHHATTEALAHLEYLRRRDRIGLVEGPPVRFVA